jgi:hypothetical protein
MGVEAVVEAGAVEGDPHEPDEMLAGEVSGLV